MSLKVEIHKDTFDSVIRAMRDVEQSEERVLKTAVNNTARKAQRLLIQKAARAYDGKAARPGMIRDASSITKATVARLEAVVSFKGPAHDVKDFHVLGMKVASPYLSRGRHNSSGERWNNRRPKGNVLKGSAKEFSNAFVVKFKNGHVAVVSRSEKENAKKFQGKPEIPHYRKLKKWISPSYMKMIGNEKVYDPDEIGDILDGEVRTVMQKVLEGGK